MKRWLVFLLTSVSLLLSTNVNSADIAVRGDSRIDVIYISAADCVNCKSWRYMRGGDWARFSETESAKSITLVTVDKVSIRNLMKREFYPKEYGFLFDKSSQFGNNIPAWWVMVDGEPVIRRVGEDRWKVDIEPALEKLVAAKRRNGGTVPTFTAIPPKPAFVPTDIADADRVPYLTAKAKEAYRRFLTTKTPRAFALSPDGSYAWWYGSTEPQKKAVDNCNAMAFDAPCQLYVVDNQVVWKSD
jgi:hypothetical protein